MSQATQYLREITTTEEYGECERGDVLQFGDVTAVVVDTPPSLIGPPRKAVVTSDGRQGEFAVGVLDSSQFDTDDPIGGAAWRSDLPDEVGVSPERSVMFAEYGDLYVRENDPSTITDWLPETDERVCPVCGDDTDVFQHKTVESDGTIREVYRCSADDTSHRYQYVHQFDADADQAVVNLHTREGEPRKALLSGMYELHETGNWDGFAAVGQGKDTPEGVYTASEVASFINAKMNTDGEAERFGVAEYGGPVGKSRIRTRDHAVTWWDEAHSWDWCAKAQFVPVDSPDELDTEY